MSFMKKMKNSGITFLCILLLMLTLNAVYAFGDTDGTELQVMQAESLEVQLGEEWAGVQFQLMTDAGIYPEKIAVGNDGILRLELGGSSTYTLSCLSSAVAVPDQNDEEPQSDKDEKDNKKSEAKELEAEEANGKTVAGIPVIHIVLFAGGMIIAIAALLIMKFISHSRDEDQDEYDED